MDRLQLKFNKFENQVNFNRKLMIFKCILLLFFTREPFQGGEVFHLLLLYKKQWVKILPE
jgi:hypothetical protein